MRTTNFIKSLLLVAILCLCDGTSAYAQFTKTIETLRADDWGNEKAAVFKMDDIASALETTPSTLTNSLNSWKGGNTSTNMFFLSTPDGLSDNYTAVGGKGNFWVNADGFSQAWTDETKGSLRWFNRLSWDNSIFKIFIGHFPGQCDTGDVFYPSFVLKMGDKEVTFRITYLIKGGKRSFVSPQTTGFVKSSSTDDYYYLYNTGAGKFFTEGNDWGTQASVGDKGLKVAFTEVSDGVYNLQNLSLKKEGWYPVFINNDQKLFVDGVKTNCITNGDLSSNDFSCFKSKEAASDILDVTIGEGLGPNSGRAIVVTSADNPSEVSDTQFFISGTESLAAGLKFHVEFDYKASKNATASTQVHGEPGSYIHGEAIGNVDFTTEWQHFSKDVLVTNEMSGMKTLVFCLAEESTATTYYFSNIVFESKSECDFSIQNNGTTFRIYGAATNLAYNASAFPNKYVGVDITSNSNNTALSPFLEESIGHYIDWALVSSSDYESYMNNSSAMNKALERLYTMLKRMDEHGIEDHSNWLSVYENTESTLEQLQTAIDEIDALLKQSGIIYIENSQFDVADWGWQYNESCGKPVFENGVGEVYENKFDVYQEFEGVANGVYEIRAKAFFRWGYAQQAWDNRNTDTPTTQLYANDIAVNVANIASDYFTSAPWVWEQDFVQVAENVYLPNNRNPAAQAFWEGKYENVVRVMVTDGKLRIGIRNLNGVNSGAWSCFDDFRVSFMGTGLDIHVDEAGTLGDLILAQVENFSDVAGLTISGKLNSTDLKNLKSRLTNVQYLDISETDVTTIPDEQFYSRRNLKVLKLPKGLKKIGKKSFYHCANLGVLEFPATLRIIDEYACYNCYSFREVSIPEGVETIGPCAFGMNNSYYYYEGENRVRAISWLHTVTLPSTLKTFGGSAFYGCENLKTIHSAEGLEQIGDYAFANCTSLSSVELSEGVKSIGDYAFKGCTNLEEVYLPSTLASIKRPFYNCDKLAYIVLNAVLPPLTNGYNVMDGKESQCTLVVPSYSANTYKQKTYWDQFNIVGADVFPQNIIINQAFSLSWPETVTQTYKPNVTLVGCDEPYGILTVTGIGTLSAKQFSQEYDFYNNYKNSSRTVNFSSLINRGSIRTDENKIQLYLYADRWSFICLPFDVKVSDIEDDGNGAYVIRKYDGQKRANGEMSETWVQLTPDSILHAGQGYIWHTASYKTDNTTNYLRSFVAPALQTVNKNNMFRNEDVDVPLSEYLSEFPQNRGWNLTGNPYPCYFDSRAMATSAPITVWTKNNSYAAYSPIDDSYILTPGEAFFIQCPINQNSVTLLKEGRQSYNTARDISYFNNARSQNVSEQKRSVFNLRLLNGEQESDRTRFVINNQAKMDYEPDKDASKFFAEQSTGFERIPAQLYTINRGVRYAINERPLSTGEVLLGMMIASKGTYTLKLDTKAENEVYLIDQQMGTEVRLDEQGYAFESEAGTFDNRFMIRLGNGDVTGIKTVDSSLVKKDEYYNLNGVRIQQPKRGLYIHNGKKVVVQ